MDIDEPTREDAPRPFAARFASWFNASPAELVGLAVLLLGALAVSGLVLLDAWRRPAELPPAASVGDSVDSWPPADAATGGGHVGDEGTGTSGAEASSTGASGAGALGPPGSSRAPSSSTEAHAEVEVVVHVSGAVHDRGVVTLQAGSRVADAIDAAGGVTADADTDRLNLARVLTDGEQVHIPAEGETVHEPAPPKANGQSAADGVIDLNRATQSELETLPGIGPAKAAAIIEHRESVGPFQVPGDIRAVPGIGEATFQRLAEHVTVR